jgi:hypothetical protein
MLWGFKKEDWFTWLTWSWILYMMNISSNAKVTYCFSLVYDKFKFCLSYWSNFIVYLLFLSEGWKVFLNIYDFFFVVASIISVRKESACTSSEIQNIYEFHITWYKKQVRHSASLPYQSGCVSIRTSTLISLFLYCIKRKRKENRRCERFMFWFAGGYQQGEELSLSSDN